MTTDVVVVTDVAVVTEVAERKTERLKVKGGLITTIMARKATACQFCDVTNGDVLKRSERTKQLSRRTVVQTITQPPIVHPLTPCYGESDAGGQYDRSLANGGILYIGYPFVIPPLLSFLEFPPPPRHWYQATRSVVSGQ